MTASCKSGVVKYHIPETDIIIDLQLRIDWLLYNWNVTFKCDLHVLHDTLFLHMQRNSDAGQITAYNTGLQYLKQRSTQVSGYNNLYLSPLPTYLPT